MHSKRFIADKEWSPPLGTVLVSPTVMVAARVPLTAEPSKATKIDISPGSRACCTSPTLVIACPFSTAPHAGQLGSTSTPLPEAFRVQRVSAFLAEH